MTHWDGYEAFLDAGGANVIDHRGPLRKRKSHHCHFVQHVSADCATPFYTVDDYNQHVATHAKSALNMMSRCMAWPKA